MNEHTAPFFGRIPRLGELVRIDFFGDAEEITGVVAFLSDEHISVTWDVHGHHQHRRFFLKNCATVEVLD